MLTTERVLPIRVQLLLVHREQARRARLSVLLRGALSVGGGPTNHLLTNFGQVDRVRDGGCLLLADHLLQAARPDAVLEALARHLLRQERARAARALRRVVEDHLLVLAPGSGLRRQRLLSRLDVPYSGCQCFFTRVNRRWSVTLARQRGDEISSSHRRREQMRGRHAILAAF